MMGCVMAYGSPWNARGFEPDPRDVVEDAARAAGMSVSQWLNRAVNDDFDGEYGSHGARRNRQQRRRYGQDGTRDNSRRDSAQEPQYSHGYSEDRQGYSEDRVARILEDAMESVHNTVRTNERRTASAIEALGRQINGKPAYLDEPTTQSSEKHEGNQVRALISELQRVLGATSTTDQNNENDRKESEHQPSLQDPNFVKHLEDRISNMVQALETRSQPAARQNVTHGDRSDPRQMASIGKAIDEMNTALRGLDQKVVGLERPPQSNNQPIADLISEMAALRQSVSVQQPKIDLSSVEHQIASVAARVDALSNKVSNSPAPVDTFSKPIERIHQELSRLSQNQQGGQSSGEVMQVLQTLDRKIDNMERQPTGAKYFDGLFEEIAALRSSIQTKTANPVQGPSSQGLLSIEKQIASMSDRLDAIVEKLASPRFNGPRDLRAQQPVANTAAELGALEELKRLITSNNNAQNGGQVFNDEKVLNALQMLERKVDAIERAPSDLAARLDRIQSSMNEKPSEPLPANIEILLRNLSARLETVQAVPTDETAFARLQEDIQNLSRKLEATPSAMQSPAIADMSGLERSMSDHFRQLDAWKADLGMVTEQAAHKAASKVAAEFANQSVSHVHSGASLAENQQVQRALTDIHVSQQEAERRTNQTLEAVHDTLRSVVDRLVEMERDAHKRSDVPNYTQASSQPQSHHGNSPAMFAAPVQKQESAPAAFDSSHFTSGIEGYAPLPLMPLPLEPLAAAQQPPVFQQAPVALQPPVFHAHPSSQTSESDPSEGSFASTLASMRAQRLGMPTPTVAEEPKSKSAIAAAFTAARGAVANIKLGKAAVKDDEPKITPEFDGSLMRSEPQSTFAAPLDLPLEPGSGRPVPGARPTPQDAAFSDPKADFLAAARRAAQAAADQSAEVLAQGSSQALSKGKSALKGASSFAASEKVGLKKKHAILLGLAALIVAVGASVQFMGGLSQKVARPADAPERTSSLSVPQRAPVQQTQLAAPRQILPPTTIEAMPPSIQSRKIDTPKNDAIKNDERISTAPTRAALPNAAFQPTDPATVGSLGSEATRSAPPSLNAPSVAASLAAPLATPIAPAKPTVAISSDPLFKFEGLRDADRLKEAARSGDPSAFIELGNRFADGRGATRDPKTAALWFERAADFGSAPAQYRLGSLYREGRGVERNPKIALKYFLAAAEAGNARAMHNTAVLLAEGVNGSPDYAGAAEWFKKSSEYGIKDSQFNLAILFARGLGTTQDLMASYAWFAAAAGHGDEDASKKRDEVGSRLSADRLLQAKAAAETWKPKTPDPSSNEVTIPSGGWDNQAKATSAAPKAKQSRL
jgi:localization factor PodJL